MQQIIKPDWKNAPEWAEYLAQNEDGTWTFFENEPFAYDYEWRQVHGKKQWHYVDIENWTESLETRPDKQCLDQK